MSRGTFRAKKEYARLVNCTGAPPIKFWRTYIRSLYRIKLKPISRLISESRGPQHDKQMECYIYCAPLFSSVSVIVFFFVSHVCSISWNHLYLKTSNTSVWIWYLLLERLGHGLSCFAYVKSFSESVSHFSYTTPQPSDTETIDPLYAHSQLFLVKKSAHWTNKNCDHAATDSVMQIHDICVKCVHSLFFLLLFWISFIVNRATSIGLWPPWAVLPDPQHLG